MKSRPLYKNLAPNEKTTSDQVMTCRQTEKRLLFPEPELQRPRLDPVAMLLGCTVEIWQSDLPI